MSLQKGQALIESLLLMPFIKLLFLGGLLMSYSFISYYYIDYEFYQGALCLEKEFSYNECQNKFVERIKQVPFLEIHWTNLSRNSLRLYFEGEISTLTMKHKQFSYQWRRPLRPEDFGEYQ